MSSSGPCGCANQAEVDFAVSAPTQLLDLAIFQNAQQFGRQIHGQCGNLVEKQRAPVRQFDLAGPGLLGPVNAPRSPAEQASTRSGFPAGRHELSRTKGFSARLLSATTARAASSFPVPSRRG